MQVTNTERRHQILEATIDLVAEAGYHEVSFAKIIKRAGLSSTRLVSYHFASREALMREALDHIVERAQSVMGERIHEAATSARDQLAAYIRSNLDFLADWPAGARAAVDIVRGLPASDGLPSQSDHSTALLEQFFVTAQAAGEMRPFEPSAMSIAVRASIDVAALRFAEGSAELQQYADEVVEIFDRATRTETRR